MKIYRMSWVHWKFRVLPVYIKRNLQAESPFGVGILTRDRRSLVWKFIFFVCKNALETSEEVKHAHIVWIHVKTIENPVDAWKTWKIWIYVPGKVLGTSGIIGNVASWNEKYMIFFWEHEDIRDSSGKKHKQNSTQRKAKTSKIGKNNIPGGCLPGMWLCVEACHGFREKGQSLRASHLGSFLKQRQCALSSMLRNYVLKRYCSYGHGLVVWGEKI